MRPSGLRNAMRVPREEFRFRILKGAKPADLPAQQPARYNLVVTLKTAATLGLAIPPSLLLRTDGAVQEGRGTGP